MKNSFLMNRTTFHHTSDLQTQLFQGPTVEVATI